VDGGDERRGKESEPDMGLIRPRTRRNTAVVQSGVDSLPLMEQAFSMGAYAVCGWQIPPLVPSDVAVGSADYLGVLRLLSMVDRDASLREIEAVVRQEPEIAFRLLQHIDSMGFGLSVPVQNFQQAVMFMGYQGLRRWLSLMLVSVSADESRRPLMLASFRRGLILEQLAGRDVDSELREEMFLLGVFSLLDRALGQPFSTLLAKVRVPDAVREALVEGTGPHVPLLRVVESIEQGPTPDLLVWLENSHLGLDACNRAILATLRVVEVLVPLAVVHESVGRAHRAGSSVRCRPIGRARGLWLPSSMPSERSPENMNPAAPESRIVLTRGSYMARPAPVIRLVSTTDNPTSLPIGTNGINALNGPAPDPRAS